MAAMALKARTALAARIAMVDHARLNEIVANGFYPALRPTGSGIPRIFDVNDIVVLRVFTHLLDEGHTPRAAGPLVEELRGLLHQHPQVDRVVHVKNGFGSTTWLRWDDFDARHNFISGSNIVSFRVWSLGLIRDRVEHMLREEAATLGTD